MYFDVIDAEQGPIDWNPKFLVVLQREGQHSCVDGERNKLCIH